jgi:hypothetical protein
MRRSAHQSLLDGARRLPRCDQGHSRRRTTFGRLGPTRARAIRDGRVRGGSVVLLLVVRRSRATAGQSALHLVMTCPVSRPRTARRRYGPSCRMSQRSERVLLGGTTRSLRAAYSAARSDRMTLACSDLPAVRPGSRASTRDGGFSERDVEWPRVSTRRRTSRRPPNPEISGPEGPEPKGRPNPAHRLHRQPRHPPSRGRAITVPPEGRDRLIVHAGSRTGGCEGFARRTDVIVIAQIRRFLEKEHVVPSKASTPAVRRGTA